MSDDDARRRIREDWDTTFVVEASAGTGKTTELVGRVVGLVCAGRASLAGVLATTFTDKAAGELKLRLRQELERRRTGGGVEGARALRAIQELERARIGTIHSVCTDLLREFPVEAGLDPRFEVLAEDRARALFAEGFRGWFEREVTAPREGVRRVLGRGRGGRRSRGPRERLFDAGWEICQNRDCLAPYPRAPFERAHALAQARDAVARLGRHALRGSDALSLACSLAAAFSADVDRRAAAGAAPEDALDELESELEALAARIQWRGGRTRGEEGGVDREEAARDREAARAVVQAALAACRADVAALLSTELRELVERYEAAKRARGAIDFLDLLLCTRALLLGSEGARRAISAEVERLFVDEFQDTDPVQVDIVLLLSGDGSAGSVEAVQPAPGKVFLVGDPKQSIYGFRRADLGVYERTKQRLVAAGAEVLTLSRSHRALPEIQSLVNGAFEQPLARGHARDPASQAPWAPLALGRGLQGRPAQPAVVALPAPSPYRGDRVSPPAVRASLAPAVAELVSWLVRASGFRVEEDGAWVPMAWRHVCLLAKRLESGGEDITRPWVDALEERRVPHVLLGGRSFHAREEVAAFRAALGAVEHVRDELAVYAALRGPLFGLTDDALLAFREGVREGLGRATLAGTLSPMRRLDPAWLEGEQAGDLRAVADALELLRELHVHRNRRPFAATCELLLERTRAHAGIALLRGGDTALANVLRVVDLARQAEERGLSFRSFVEELDAGGAPEGPLVEEGTDGVRFMTVHRAKGLEFPVVILLDPTAGQARKEPSRHVDAAGRLFVPLADCAPRELLEAAEVAAARDRDEALRVTYVAATRARDLLVVPVIGDEIARPGGDGWLDVLGPAVFPAPPARRSARPAPGCPPFGGDSVLDRPPGPVGEEASVRPGEHLAERGGHPVVFWDPAALAREPEDLPIVRYQWLLEPADGLAAPERFEVVRARELQRAAEPSLRASPLSRTPGERALRHADDVEVLDAARGPAPGRPRGSRFGTLVHAVLAEAPLHADAARVARVARLLGRVVGATEEEIVHAAAAASAALDHELFARARRSPDVRREEPLVVRQPDGEYREGVVDLAFAEGGGWVVVDYKTDAEIGADLPRYRAQVAAYADALADALGARVRGFLLRV